MYGYQKTYSIKLRVALFFLRWLAEIFADVSVATRLDEKNGNEKLPYSPAWLS